MKNKNTQNSARKPQHLFRRIRDPLVTDASNGANPSAIALTADANGNGTATYALSPFGISGFIANATTATGPINFTSAVYYSPNLPWLFNQARNFERYRVLNATLIVIGNVGSSATGRMVVDSSTDLADNVTAVTVGLSTGGIVFDVASLAGKERRFQVDVDSSWKKCSSRTALVSNNGSLLMTTSSANDLLFTNIYFSVNGATAAGTTGTFTVANFMLEYDVEFRDPISYGANV